MATMAMLEQQHHRLRGLQPPGRGSRLLVAAVDERLPPPSHGGNGGWGLLDADAGRHRMSSELGVSAGGPEISRFQLKSSVLLGQHGVQANSESPLEDTSSLDLDQAPGDLLVSIEIKRSPPLADWGGEISWFQLKSSVLPLSPTGGS